MDKIFLQSLTLYRGKSALQINPSPELALVFVSLAPAIPGMENRMPDKNGKKYQWEKKLTASFNFDGALEIAAAAAALAARWAASECPEVDACPSAHDRL